uniref:Secreted protein n=1 Tax=Plectus sambesii TaxID=2011161 RepID=A0A914WFE0_9BILA
MLRFTAPLPAVLMRLVLRKQKCGEKRRGWRSAVSAQRYFRRTIRRPSGRGGGRHNTPTRTIYDRRASGWSPSSSLGCRQFDPSSSSSSSSIATAGAAPSDDNPSTRKHCQNPTLGLGIVFLRFPGPRPFRPTFSAMPGR